jgi:hypothetical protein
MSLIFATELCGENGGYGKGFPVRLGWGHHLRWPGRADSKTALRVLSDILGPITVIAEGI